MPTLHINVGGHLRCSRQYGQNHKPAVYGQMPELFFFLIVWHTHIVGIFFEGNFNVQIAVMRAWTTVLKDAQFKKKMYGWEIHGKFVPKDAQYS